MLLNILKVCRLYFVFMLFVNKILSLCSPYLTFLAPKVGYAKPLRGVLELGSITPGLPGLDLASLLFLIERNAKAAFRPQKFTMESYIAYS